MSPSALIHLQGVKKTVYSQTVLHQLDYSFSTQSVTWIKASEKEGKSLLTNILCKVEDPDAGSVKWENGPGRFMGVVFETAALISNLSIAQNLALALDHFRVNLGGREKMEYIKEQLQLWKLSKTENLRPVALSRSQCFRVALMRGLIAAPRVLLWDDAFECFDEEEGRFVQNKLEAAQKAGTALICLSRRPSPAWDTACQEIKLIQGRLEA